MWRFLAYFGLTARDLLPDDYRVVDDAALKLAAGAASGPDPTELDAEVSSILTDASSRAGGTAQVLHVMAELLARSPWQERLQSGLSRFGISASEVVRELNNVVPSIDLRSSTPAGEQIGRWLSQRFPLRPATMASFSNDLPDPRADFIGVSEEADAFAYLIASTTLAPPLAIGLFGNWGSGKSFLMAKIRERVRQLTALASVGESASADIWTKVVPIEFNAWQYVETDLWAALLARIFDELSPEARRKLTELSRQQQELRAQKDDNLREQLRAISEVEKLRKDETAQVREAEEAAEQVARVKGQVATLTAAAVEGALSAHARSTATAVLIGGIGTVLEPIAETVEEARRLEILARAPAWSQLGFWTLSRVVWVSLAVLVVPVLVVVLDLRGFEPPTALTAALGTCAALLVPVLRAAAGFVEGQQKASVEAARNVEQRLSRLVKEAEDDRATKDDEVKKTRSKIEVEQQKVTQAAAQGIDLDSMAARLNVRSVYAEFLSGRNISDDYRKRLGIVTTVSDDLETLSGLIADYNAKPEAQLPDGPPNRIVLYIDDLDRCPPPRVVEVLEAIHLLLAFPLFVVVVAVDTRWLTAALSRALPILKEKAAPGVGAPTAMDYLEKIFQIPFWVEPLDDGGRHRLLRGLLLPSIAQSTDGGAPRAGTAVTFGSREQEAAESMLAVHGPWLDRDAQKFTITATELAFVEGLTPLVAGTPRQVKRFVNICKLLLAMSPPLAAGEEPATERTAACFMAAVHQSMPAFATQLAAAAASSGPGATLEKLLSELADPELADDRQQVKDWLATQPPAAPSGRPFGSADASMLVKRWDVLRRLRFADNEPNQRATPEAVDDVSGGTGARSTDEPCQSPSTLPDGVAASGPFIETLPAGVADAVGRLPRRHGYEFRRSRRLVLRRVRRRRGRRVFRR